MDSKTISKRMVDDILYWMAIGGCNPFERIFKKRVLGYAFVIVSALIVILVMMNFIYSPHKNISSLMEDSIMFFGFIQIGSKYFTAMQKSEVLANMLESLLNDFWSLKDFDDEFQKNALVLYKRAKYLSNFYGISILSSSISFIIQAGVKQDKTLIIEIWIPHKEILKTSPYYEMMYIFQAIFIIAVCMFCLIQLDKLFIMLICFVFVQQKMIQAKFLLICKENSKQQNYNIMRGCVIHHNILFEFLKSFETVFSRLFLPTVGTNFILISLTMYGAIMEESLNRKLTVIFIYFSVTGQLFAYCYAAHLIQEEGMNIGEAAYNCNWNELDDQNVSMGLALISLRSQRKIELTVGGIMILSLENFATVFRASFTFLTFIVNIRN